MPKRNGYLRRIRFYKKLWRGVGASTSQPSSNQSLSRRDVQLNFQLDVLQDMAEAFKRGVIETEHGLEWAVPARGGYGMCSWSTEGFSLQVGAHRVGWMLANGQVPLGYDVDHEPQCPKTCVTAEHLQILTKSEHTKLGWERGQLNGGWGTKRERLHPPKPEPFAWQQERECKNCSTLFLPTTGKNLHCSRDCHCKYKEKLRKPRRYPRPDKVICQWLACGGVFTPKRRDSKFCSRTCTDAHQRQKKKERRDHARSS